ncbi:MAG TPA: hypothetical protein PKJ19_07890 [Flavobacteriales bacterium]|nr:hypothetical protein [Flavobacteriales bacterium]
MAKKSSGKKPSQKGKATSSSGGLTPGKTETQETVAVQSYGDGIDDAIAERICELIEDTPKGLDHICESDRNLVSARTFHRWLEKSLGLRQRYARARERQADLMASEVVRIADTPRNGIKKKTNADGSVEIMEGDMIEHRRLQIDARKWMAGKLAPKKYGEKLDLTSDGKQIQAPVVTFQSSPDA